MRGKARRADKNHEIGDSRDEKDSEERIMHRGLTKRQPSKFKSEQAKKTPTEETVLE
jgi:hypothetical protein